MNFIPTTKILINGNVHVCHKTCCFDKSFDHESAPKMSFATSCFSDRFNCSHWSFGFAVPPIKPNIYTDQCEPVVIYHSITLRVVIIGFNHGVLGLAENPARGSGFWSQNTEGVATLLKTYHIVYPNRTSTVKLVKTLRYDESIEYRNMGFSHGIYNALKLIDISAAAIW